jgi:hypothetical protein
MTRADRSVAANAAAIAAAANAVKQARKALNDHRDSSRAGLARLRTHTLDAVALTGILSFLLVIVATVYGSRRLQLTSAAAFFLVAAVIGLIAALNSMSSLTTADVDFGLASVRLIANTVLSGLSGVGGVVLVYLSGATGALLEAATSARTGGTAPAGLLLNDIFDVVNRPVTLVVAAVFGATPALLITGLAKLGDQYAMNLTSTHPSSIQKKTGP